jgi:ribonuclease BN (tRNA processing enzyme)
VNSSPGHVALAVHEATDCYIPTHVDPQQQTGKNRSVESVHSVSLQRGHSTPHMAGKFANKIGARRLVLNHIGGKVRSFFSPCVIQNRVYSLVGSEGFQHQEGWDRKTSSVRT